MPRLFLTIWAGKKKNPKAKQNKKTKKPGTLHKIASAGAVADCTRSPVHGLGWGWGVTQLQPRTQLWSQPNRARET